MSVDDARRLNEAFGQIKAQFDVVMGSVAEGQRSRILKPPTGSPFVASEPVHLRKAIKSLQIGDTFGLKAQATAREIRYLAPGTPVPVIEKDDSDATTLYYTLWDGMATEFGIYSACKDVKRLLPTFESCTDSELDIPKVIAHHAPDGVPASFKRQLTLQVRILQGPMQGQAGWVAGDQIELPTVPAGSHPSEQTNTKRK